MIPVRSAQAFGPWGAINKKKMMKKSPIGALTLVGAILTTGGALYSQQPPRATASDQDIQLLRQDIRSQKKQMVAANMPLTDAEAEKFWPVYDQYTAETIKANDARYALIKEYATSYVGMTDDQARSLTKKAIEVDESFVQLRLKYMPIFEKVMPAKKVALFFQIDRRLGLLIDLQLAASIPVVNP